MAKVLGYAQEQVLPINSNALPGRAPRPINVSLDNSKAQRELSTPMCMLEQGLELVLKSKETQDEGF